MLSTGKSVKKLFNFTQQMYLNVEFICKLGFILHRAVYSNSCFIRKSGRIFWHI